MSKPGLANTAQPRRTPDRTRPSPHLLPGRGCASAGGAGTWPPPPALPHPPSPAGWAGWAGGAQRPPRRTPHLRSLPQLPRGRWGARQRGAPGCAPPALSPSSRIFGFSPLVSPLTRLAFSWVDYCNYIFLFKRRRKKKKAENKTHRRKRMWRRLI